MRLGSARQASKIFRLYENAFTRIASFYWPLLPQKGRVQGESVGKRKRQMSYKPGSSLSVDFNIIYR